MRPSPSSLRLRSIAAVLALGCAGLSGAVPLALAQPKPSPSSKAASSKGAPSASASATPSAPSTGIIPDTIEGSEELQRLYLEGEDALKRLSFAEADVAFTKAWAQSKSFDVAGRLGETKLDLGKYREAAQYLSFALRNALPSTRASRRDALKKYLDDAKKKLATIKLTSSIIEAKITIDGAAIETIFLGPEIFVDPGKHTFEASSTGYETAKQTVDTKAGEIFVVNLTLVRATVAPLVPSGSASASSGTPWPAAVIGGAGGLGVVLGAIFVGIAEAKKGDAHTLVKDTLTADGKATCPKQGPGPTAQCDAVRNVASQSDTFGNAGIGAFIAGGVLLAGAAGYMFLLAPKDDAKVPPKAGRIIPVVTPQGGGFVWRGSF